MPSSFRHSSKGVKKNLHISVSILASEFKQRASDLSLMTSFSQDQQPVQRWRQAPFNFTEYLFQSEVREGMCVHLEEMLTR